jgi:hypothetical protein
MSTEEFKFFLMFIGVMGTLTAFTVSFRAWMRRPRDTTALQSDLTERLERIERAVEVTALEVERIGESQRFLTRALGERARVEPQRGDSTGRVITPH